MKKIDLIKPDIYERFQCKGADCRRTCCAGWRIAVSKAEYQDLKGRLHTTGKKLLQRFPTERRTPRSYGEFVLAEKKGCPLQSEEGLCGLQLSHGFQALPKLCAGFPRNGIRYRDQMQLSLTPACEKVMELLLEKDGPLEFVREKEAIPQIPTSQVTGETEEADWNHYMQLEEFCILLLQAQDVSLDIRMALLGLGIHQIDAYCKQGELFRVSAYIGRFLSMLSENEDVGALVAAEGLDPVILLGNFLSSLSYSATSIDDWAISIRVKKALGVTPQQQKGSNEGAFSYSMEQYRQHKERFDDFTKSHPYFLENVMVQLFAQEHWASLPRTYQSLWEQYMYACWVYSNLKFVLTACMEEGTSDAELLDICVVLFRSWIHDEEVQKKAVKQLHENECDTPAHMAMLVQAG